MRYYHETEHVSVSEPCSDRFVISIKDPEPEVKPRYYYSTTKDYLMDMLGRISDVGFDHIETDPVFSEKRGDGFFIATKDKIKYLIDSNSNIIASDVKSVSRFNGRGIACVEFSDRSYWVDTKGKFYGDEFADVGWFDHGFAPVRLKNGRCSFVNENFELVGKEFDKTFILFSGKFYGAEIEGSYYVLDRDFNVVSAPLDNIFVVTDYGYIIKHQNKDKFFGLEIVDMSGKRIASGKIINGYDSKLLRIQDDGYWFFNQETGKIIGGKTGFKYADEFNGEFTSVLLGYDERGEGIYTFIHEDGSMFLGTYEMAYMVKENIGAFYVPNKKGTSGKYFLIGPDERQIGNTGYKNLHSFGADGLAIYRKGKDTWSAIDETFHDVGFEFDGISGFVDGFTTIKEGEKRKIIDKSGVKLSQISELAQKIENDFNLFFNLPEEILSDEPLITRLYNLAQNVVASKFLDPKYKGDSQSLNYKLKSLESAYTQYILAIKFKNSKHK